MSTAISSASAISYATQLAGTSALRRSLASLGAAIQHGELVPASTILTAFFKSNPQYTSTANTDSQTQDALSQDFQALATALSNNQVDAAQSAWTNIKNDFAKDGVTNLGDATNSTSELLAQSKASTDEQIVSDMFGASSGGNPSIATLLGESDASSSQIGVPSSLMENWLTYKQTGTAAPAATNPGTPSVLDTAV
jgi:hypothetical protein